MFSPSILLSLDNACVCDILPIYQLCERIVAYIIVKIAYV